MPTFVQFLHSGKEYSITPTEKLKGLKDWNYGVHRRKFLKAKGHYVDTSGKTVGPADLLFWGEWEPESKLTPLASGWLHEPDMQLNPGGHVVAPATKMVSGTVVYRQNTDPFVFENDGFLFSCCHQARKCMPTSLQSLDSGSIVVFGSCIGNQFAVDTVLVVGSFKDYDASSIAIDLNGFVWNSQLYEEILGQGLCAPFPRTCASMPQYRCYKGATPSRTVNGMYSFAPCQLATEGDKYFQRPILSSSALSALKLTGGSRNMVISGQKSWFKTTSQLSMADMTQIWNVLYDELITKPNLLPGTKFYY